jgi:hypothetical protein|nr:hypothetical protein [Aeromicrobium sp.]
MAKKTIEIITSDLSGEELERGQGETIIFSVGGADYSVDLTDDEAKDFYAAFDKYTKVATKRSSGRGGPRKGTSGSGRSSEELAHIRAWANENGHPVSERGRIKAEVIDAFDQANN